MKTDSLFYRLFQTLPQLLFDLIEQPPDHAIHYHFESVELKQTAFRMDGVLQPPADQPDWPVFFVEVQFQLDPELYSAALCRSFSLSAPLSPNASLAGGGDLSNRDG